MNRLATAVFGLSLLVAGAACAQPGPGGPGGPGMRTDADGDGVVTAAEFEASALQRFERNDANKDGVVDAAEIDAIKKRFESREGGEGGPPAGFAARLIAQMTAQDADKDGRITKDEALAAARAQFAAMDKNADGKLTGDEFRMGPPGGRPPQ